MTNGNPVLYRPSSGGEYVGECRGVTKLGRVRVQVTGHADGRPLSFPWQVITTPSRVEELRVEREGCR